MTFDESGRRDTLGLSLFGDGIEEGLLLLGDIGEYLAEYGIVRCYLLSMADSMISGVHTSPSGVSAKASLKVFCI